MNDLIKEVQDSDNSREAFIALKNKINEKPFTPDEEDTIYLIRMLELPDPKSRKNVAQIIGILHIQSAAGALYNAYEKEETEYVKSAYLRALKNINIESFRTKLDSLRKSLSESAVSDENRKHYNEQMAAFNDLLGSSVKKHTFIGANIMSEVMLTTPSGLAYITADNMLMDTKRVLSMGVCARILKLDEVQNIRTYKELLFLVPNLKKVPYDAISAAEMIAGGELKNFLNSRHKEKDPWGFRVSLFSKADEKKKTTFIKDFSGELQRKSEGFFVNQPSDYEVEIRLLENREGSLTVMIKLFTIADKRFDYRQEFVSASIRPELAANLVYLAADYLKSGVQVLDPFCGVGTMLIERYKYRKASPLYGIDTYGDAIEKAKKNAKKSDTEIFFINRNYFDFKHDHMFDEIITNMPFSNRDSDQEKIEDIYRQFFEYSKKLLRKGSYVIIYARNIGAARRYSAKFGYELEKEVKISEKENSYLCIYKRK
jgi:tRNA G10  N-methylase Trm11